MDINFKIFAFLLFTTSIITFCLLGSFQAVDSASPRQIEAPLDSASVLSVSSPIKRVVLGNEKVARVQVINARQLLIFGKQIGRSTLHIWTERGLRKYLLRIRELPENRSTDVLKALDQQDTGMELRVLSPQYREISEFENYLEQLLKKRGEVVLSDPAAGKIFVLAPPSILDKVERLLDRIDVPGQKAMYTRRIKLANRPVNEMKKKVEAMLTDKGKVIIDEETNSLMLVDKVDKVQQIVSFLKKIDVKTVAQVRIEAKFVEMTDEAERQMGINWDYEGSVDGQNLNAALSPELGKVDNVGGLQLDLVDPANAFNLTATMQFLESEGLVNLISSPNVMTRNQQEAVLEIVNEQSYTAGWNVSQTDGGGLNVTPIVETKEGGITLQATPLIGRSDVIQLDLTAEMKIIDLGDPIIQQAASNQYPFYTPTVDRRTAELNVALRDEQTLVIGGLNREQTDSSQDQVPLLGQIPLIGSLFFSQNTKSKANSKITIFLTAEIVRLTENDRGLPNQSGDTTAGRKNSIIGSDTLPANASVSDSPPTDMD